MEYIIRPGVGRVLGGVWRKLGGGMGAVVIRVNCIHVRASQKYNKKETSQEMDSINIYTVVG